jgi:hypothetical protein
LSPAGKTAILILDRIYSIIAKYHIHRGQEDFQSRNIYIHLLSAAHIDALALKIAHAADLRLFRPPGRAVEIGVGTELFS